MFDLDTWIKFHYCAKLGGEGYGSTYEYVAKFYLLKEWDKRYGLRGKFDTLVILGLPQKYGLGLDFLMWADYLDISRLIIWNNEPPKGEMFINLANELVRKIGIEKREINLIEKLDDVLVNTGTICVSCEVFQGLCEEKRWEYVEKTESAKMNFVFVPNYYNKAHIKITGLPTIEDNALVKYFKAGHLIYLDMPPVPPGFELPKGKRHINVGDISVVDRLILFLLNMWFWLMERSVFPKLKWVETKISHLVGFIQVKNLGTGYKPKK